MAAALLPVAGQFAQPISDFAHREAREFEQDPLLWVEQRLWKYGWVSLAAGVAMSAVGFILRTAGTRAQNDEDAFLAQEAAIFNNLGGPQLTALSWNVGQDIGTALDDAATVAAWVPQEVYNGISDVGQALWLGLKNLPRLLWDDLNIVAGFTLGNALDFAFPFLIIAGGIAIAVAIVLRFLRTQIVPRTRIAVRAKWSEYVEQPLDRVFGISTALPIAEKAELHEEAIEAAGARDPDPTAAIHAEAQAELITVPEVTKEGDGEAPPANGPPADEGTPATTPLGPSDEPPAPEPATNPPETPPEGPEPPEPLTGPTPTAETEAILGGDQALEPTAEEVQAMEAGRQETLVEPEPIAQEPPPEPSRPAGKEMAQLVGEAFG